MNNDWAVMAECLRTEISEYGKLLTLIDDQHKLIFKGDPAEILRLNPSIQAQVEVLHACRGHREKAVRESSAARDEAPGRTMRSVLPLAAAEGGPSSPR